MRLLISGLICNLGLWAAGVALADEAGVTGEYPRLEYSTLETARMLALHLSDEREVPQELEESIYQDLQLIFAEHPYFAELLPNVPFMPILVVRFDNDEEKDEIVDAILEDWPELTFQGRTTETSSFFWFAVDSRFHPRHIADEVRDVPGLERAFASALLGDFHHMGIDEESGEYYFRYGWGDCLAGCIYELVYRIRVTPESQVVLNSRSDVFPGFFFLRPSRVDLEHHVIRLAAGSTLTLEAASLPAIELLWLHDDEPVGESGPLLHRDAVGPEDAGVYRLLAVDLVSGDTWTGGSAVELIVMEEDYQWSDQSVFKQPDLESSIRFDLEREHAVHSKYSARHYPWLFLENQGWWFEARSSEDTFHYDLNFGWIWNTEAAPGYYFCPQSECWYADVARDDGQRIYYNLNDSVWRLTARSGW